MENRKNMRDQHTVDRHYRLPKAAYDRIVNRDKDRFPTEKDFMAEAVLSYEKRIRMEELMDRFQKIEEKLDRMARAMGWQ